MLPMSFLSPRSLVMNKEIIVLLMGICLMPSSLCSNILVMLPLPAYSHFNAYQPIFKELARRGHNVTVVSPFPLDKPIPNYNDIVITNTYKEIFESLSARDIREQDKNLALVFGFRHLCPTFTNTVFNLPEIQKIMNEDQSHFDLVILEPFFCQEPLAALSHKYNAPLVIFHPVLMSLVIASYTGNILPLSYVPHMMVAANNPMTMFQRATSSFYFLLEYLHYHFYYKAMSDKSMRDHFKYPGSENLPGVDDLLSNISLILLDNHFSLSTPQPFLPNVVEIGGLSLQDPPPLSQELESFMNESKDGVIFFSWGSHYPSTKMKPEALSKFLSVFSKLKQRVLFKWENKTLEGKPSNVRIAPWYPQASILGHPNLKVFISHCGIHGVTESVHYGVPLLATPLFGDQQQNAKFAENAGYAIVLDIDSFSEQELLQSLNKLIYDASYKEAAERQKKILRDRPLPVLENSVYWIEYVLRHGGARHLRLAHSDSGWSYILIILSPYIFLLFVTVMLFCMTIKMIFCRKKSKAILTTKKKRE